ncbi:hypothetical protein CR513_59376, partial [Mucuna pruriens]
MSFRRKNKSVFFSHPMFFRHSHRQLHTRGAERVPHRRQQELPAANPHGVVASPCRVLHQNVPGVSRIRSLPENTGACRHRLQRRTRRPLVVTVLERIRNGPRQHRGQVDNHPVNPNVGVGSH